MPDFRPRLTRRFPISREYRRALRRVRAPLRRERDRRGRNRQQHQVLEALRLAAAAASPGAERAVEQCVRLHVVLDQPARCAR